MIHFVWAVGRDGFAINEFPTIFSHTSVWIEAAFCAGLRARQGWPCSPAAVFLRIRGAAGLESSTEDKPGAVFVASPSQSLCSRVSEPLAAPKIGGAVMSVAAIPLRGLSQFSRCRWRSIWAESLSESLNGRCARAPMRITTE